MEEPTDETSFEEGEDEWEQPIMEGDRYGSKIIVPRFPTTNRHSFQLVNPWSTWTDHTVLEVLEWTFKRFVQDRLQGVVESPRRNWKILAF